MAANVHHFRKQRNFSVKLCELYISVLKKLSTETQNHREFHFFILHKNVANKIK